MLSGMAGYVFVIFAILWDQPSSTVSTPLVLSSLKSLDTYVMSNLSYVGDNCISEHGGLVLPSRLHADMSKRGSSIYGFAYGFYINLNLHDVQRICECHRAGESCNCDQIIVCNPNDLRLTRTFVSEKMLYPSLQASLDCLS